MMNEVQMMMCTGEMPYNGALMKKAATVKDAIFMLAIGEVPCDTEMADFIRNYNQK